MARTRGLLGFAGTCAPAPLALLLAACVASPALAPPRPGPVPPQRHQESAVTGEEPAAEEGRRAFSLFLGGAGQLDDEYGAAYGLDFDYRIGPRWGLGAYVELVTGVERVFAGGVFAFLNPVGGWLLTAGPGVERAEEEWSPIWRLGTGYELALEGGWRVVPSVSFDFSEIEDLVVYGVSFGRSW